MRRGSRCVIAALISLGLVHGAYTQSGGLGAAGGPVFVNVTVTDKYGRWVGGLRSEHFKVFRDDALQDITSFDAEEGPISVGILVDASGSLKDSQNDLLEATRYFVKGCKARTEYFVMSFNVNHELVLDTTENSEDVFRAIKLLSVRAPQKLTALFDAIGAGLEKVSNGKHTRKALLVFTDGMDNESKIGFNDLKRRLRRSDVNLYALTRAPVQKYLPPFDRAVKDMVELTAQTGGRAMFADQRVELLEAAYKTAEELRYQYRIGFIPSASKVGESKDWYDLDVKVKLPDDAASKVGKVSVRSRRGYIPTAVANE